MMTIHQSYPIRYPNFGRTTLDFISCDSRGRHFNDSKLEYV